MSARTISILSHAFSPECLLTGTLACPFLLPPQPRGRCWIRLKLSAVPSRETMCFSWKRVLRLREAMGRSLLVLGNIVQNSLKLGLFIRKTEMNSDPTDLTKVLDML